MNAEKLASAFEEIDRDHGGSIDFKEFKAWYVQEKKRQGSARKMHKFLKKRVKGARDAGATDLAFARRQIILEVIKRSKEHGEWERVVSVAGRVGVSEVCEGGAGQRSRCLPPPSASLLSPSSGWLPDR